MLRQRIARAKGLVQAADLVKSLLASVPDEQRKTLTGIALIAGLQLALNAIKEEAEETLEQCLAYATHCGADSESDFRESLRALREDEEKN
jgi:NTP pyrophosphatase (non-canonical NTP hydrolase)